MINVADSLRRSSVNIQSISKSLSDTRKSVSPVNESVNNISNIISTNTRIKSELFSKSQVLNARRQESSLRQEREDQIEASQVSSSPIKGFAFASKSDKGPLGRLLGFLGFITAGWIVENLPTWIFMGKEFVSRIQTFGRSMYNMVDSMKLIVTSFGKLLKDSFNAIIRLDFNEFTEGSVAQSFDQLNLAVQGLGDDITETFRLFTTPLTEALETKEQAPGLGEQREETMYPGITQEGAGGTFTYTGPETTGGGKMLNPQAAYSYLRQLGVSNIHALGILANIQGESGFRIDSKQPDGPGIGLFQYSEASRKNAFLQNVPDWKTNWRGQIKYAIGEGVGPAYFKNQFTSSEEAADWWMTKWERPDPRVISGRRQKHNQFIRDFKLPTTLTNTTSIKPNNTSKLDLKKLGFSIGDRAGYSASRGRIHPGRDIAIAKGTPVSVITDATITSVGNNPGGYGYYVSYVDSNGIEHFYGHLREMPKVKKGQKLAAGTVVGYVGSTGKSTGPHLHWEISPRIGEVGMPRKSVIDPIEYGFSATAPFVGTKAQISSQPRSQQPSAITPDRKGPQIMFIDDTQPQSSQVSYSSVEQPSYTPAISEFRLLNNFIKNKLLTDLAYL